MSNEATPRTIIASEVLNGPSPFILRATLKPVADQDRFQPAGFPEVGHVIYRAPRVNGAVENVCIVDSPASMANHLESVCMRGAHDLDLVDELSGMPYLRCVTGSLDENGSLKTRDVVVTSLTEGHRIASTYFLEGERLTSDTTALVRVKKLRGEAKSAKKEAEALSEAPKKKEREKKAKQKEDEAKKIESEAEFQSTLVSDFGIKLAGSSKAHPPAEKWWDVFKTIYKYDPNALVHGVLFPQWQIKISRALTAHLEALGAGRVDRSGVKFDRLGKTTSGQPIFAVDDATAREIRATFILDVSLIRSFGRPNGQSHVGLSDAQKEFLITLALWKIQRLLESPFRFRSGCQLQRLSLNDSNGEVEIDVNIQQAIARAAFRPESDPAPIITDVYWPAEELYREAADTSSASDAQPDAGTDEGSDEDEGQ